MEADIPEGGRSILLKFVKQGVAQIESGMRKELY
jgi:hypothetical protein